MTEAAPCWLARRALAHHEPIGCFPRLHRSSTSMWYMEGLASCWMASSTSLRRRVGWWRGVPRRSAKGGVTKCSGLLPCFRVGTDVMLSNPRTRVRCKFVLWAYHWLRGKGGYLMERDGILLLFTVFCVDYESICHVLLPLFCLETQRPFVFAY